MDYSNLPPFSSNGFVMPTDQPEHEPAPGYRGDDVWSHWDMVDKANRVVHDSQEMLVELEAELKMKVEEGAKLKERSAKLHESIHRKSGLSIRLPLKRPPDPTSPRSPGGSKDAARQEFYQAHKEETTCVEKIERLTKQVESLKETISRHTPLASTVDQVFELLSASVVSTLPDYEAHTVAEERLSGASASYDQMQELVTDFTRARVTVQHAHRYYQVILRTHDSVRGTGFSRAVLGGIGEVSKQKDYRAAAERANAAQICFNETARVLTPHVAMIPRNILSDFESLKDMGLQQAADIYDLLYGWKSRTNRVSEAVDALMQRQEGVFVNLTHLGVWIQDQVPDCEARCRAARASRDQMRRDMVIDWNNYRPPVVDINVETGVAL